MHSVFLIRHYIVIMTWLHKTFQIAVRTMIKVFRLTFIKCRLEEIKKTKENEIKITYGYSL